MKTYSLEELIDLGDQAMADCNYSAAIAFYSQALKADPFNDEVLAQKADAHSNLKQFIRAHNCIDKAIGINKSEVNHWCIKALIFIEEKRYNDAIDVYDYINNSNTLRQSLAHDFGNDDASFSINYWKVKLLLMTSRYKEALESCNICLKFDSNKKSYYKELKFYQGVIYFKLQNYQDAIRYLKECISYGKSDYALASRILLALSLQKIGDNEGSNDVLTNLFLDIGDDDYMKDIYSMLIELGEESNVNNVEKIRQTYKS